MIPDDTSRILADVEREIAALDARLLPYRSLDRDLVPEALLDRLRALYRERDRALNAEAQK